jgi:hypothetical protein
MKKVWSILGIAAAAVIVGSIAGSSVPGTERRQERKVERGRYLVTTIGCADCHSPKKMGPKGPEEDLSRHLSGHPAGSNLPPPPDPGDSPWMYTASWDLTAWSGPWGISYPMNLTPDEMTGIGSWSEETFVRALRTGRHMGVSREILPPMPWQFYRNLTDEDLSAVYAYLRTIPAISNGVPLPVPPGGGLKAAK